MGKYFTEQERYKLEGMLEAGMNKRDIAKTLKKSLKTIYNEIKRGTCKHLKSDLTEEYIYMADVAQRKYDEAKINKGVANLKIGNDIDFAKFIEQKIVIEKWSPGAVIGYIKTHNLHFKNMVCEKTLYNYVNSGLFLDCSRQDLPMPRKPKKEKARRKVALKNKNARSISERKEEIDKREEFGHWELDTVVSGHPGKECLLVFTERQTRHELLYKLKGKLQTEVVDVINSIEKKLGTETFRNIFKTITMDNGVEFLDIDGIEKSINDESEKRTETYYCHPYSSWERGSNENANKLIRRFIPKGADISKYSDDDIKMIENWINNYPRRMFGWLSSNEVVQALGI